MGYRRSCNSDVENSYINRGSDDDCIDGFNGFVGGINIDNISYVEPI